LREDYYDVSTVAEYKAQKLVTERSM